MPLRPLKLRLKVRSETAPVGGAWPMPMQGPQADSRMRAPAATRSASAPLAAIIASTCRDPGEIVRLTPGWTRRPRRTAATVIRSRYEEFVQEPMQTWWTVVPASDSTV